MDMALADVRNVADLVALSSWRRRDAEGARSGSCLSVKLLPDR